MATKKKAARHATAANRAPAQVQTIVNGQVTGTIPPDGTIGDAAMNMARREGLKSYSVRVNGVPVTAAEAGGSLAGAKSIEVFAKDTRGSI